MTSAKNQHLLWAALGLLLWLAPGALAATPNPTPLRVVTPWVTSADHEVGGSVFNHTSGLAFNGGSEIGLGFSFLADGEGQGDGVFGSLATSLGPVHFGLGLARLTDGVVDTPALLRTDLGLAISLGSQASIGFGWSGLSSDEGAELDGYGSWSMSTTLRPIRSLSVGLDVDGLNKPSVAGTSTPVSGRIGLALRPGTERLTFGLDGSVQFADTPAWSVGGGMRTMLVDGFVLGAFGRYSQTGATSGALEWGVNMALGQAGMGLSTSVQGRSDDVTVGDRLSVSTLLTYSTETQPSLVDPSSVVVSLEIGGTIPERPSSGLFSTPRAPFADWLAALSAMATDDSVSGVLLRIKGAPNWTQCWELRQAISRLKRGGKRVYASLRVGDMRSVYLASAADKVYLDPSGALMVTGLAITQTYLAGAMDKLGVRAQFIAFEEHKTYPERFTRVAPSPPAKQQTQALLTHFMTEWLQAVSAGRGIASADLKRILGEGPLTMKDAIRENLVDALVDDEALKKVMENDLGRNVTLSRGYRPPPSAWERWGKRDKIAIIPIVGSIMGGKTGPAIPFVRGQNTGERSLVSTLRHVEKDAGYHGAVIRIDSPGGGVIASDVIYRAIKRLAKKKPVVVSFANVAASGGYYAAMGADTILASPMTITGSVGIFAGKADLSALYTKLGVSTDTTLSQPGADLLSMSRPWSEDEMKRLTARLGVYYERFLTLVSKGRALSMEDARKRAGGRVYDGKRALELKMIDSHGTLWDALAEVRNKAGLQGISYSYVPERAGLAQLLGKLGLGTLLAKSPDGFSPLPAILGPLVGVLTDVFSAHNGEVMARMPTHIEVL